MKKRTIFFSAFVLVLLVAWVFRFKISLFVPTEKDVTQFLFDKGIVPVATYDCWLFENFVGGNVSFLSYSISLIAFGIVIGFSWYILNQFVQDKNRKAAALVLLGMLFFSVIFRFETLATEIQHKSKDMILFMKMDRWTGEYTGSTGWTDLSHQDKRTKLFTIGAFIFGVYLTVSAIRRKEKYSDLDS
jgi:hypothetical protein